VDRKRVSEGKKNREYNEQIPQVDAVIWFELVDGFSALLSMLIVVDGYTDKTTRDSILSVSFQSERIALLSSIDESWTASTLKNVEERLSNNTYRPPFDTQKLIRYFTSVIQACKDDKIETITILVALQETFFSTSNFQAVLGRSYLNITKAVLPLRIHCRVFQFPQNPSIKSIEILRWLTLEYIHPSSLRTLDSKKTVEKRAYSGPVNTASSKKSKQVDRPMQQSYLICEPTIAEPTYFPENTLGALYCKTRERTMYGRTYGLNLDSEPVNSPRKKQRV
jgi:hypothetical protein